MRFIFACAIMDAHAWLSAENPRDTYGWRSFETPKEVPYSTGFFAVSIRRKGLWGKSVEIHHPTSTDPISFSVDPTKNWAAFGLDGDMLIESLNSLFSYQQEVLRDDKACSSGSGCGLVSGETVTLGDSIYKTTEQATETGGSIAEKCTGSDGSSICSVLAPNDRILLTKKSNCGEVSDNAKCKNVRNLTVDLIPVCLLERDEDPIFSEYVFSRLAYAQGLGAKVERISSKQPETCSASFPQHPVFSRVLIVSLPGISLSEYFETVPMSIDRFLIATRLLVQSLDLIKMLHMRGVVHGSLTDHSIRFAEDVPDSSYSNTPRLVLTNLSAARFYPSEIGTPSKIERGIWPISPYSSPYELSGHRYGRRDDVFRLFEAYIGWLSGPVFWRDMQLFTKLGPRSMPGLPRTNIEQSRLELFKYNMDFFKPCIKNKKTRGDPLKPTPQRSPGRPKKDMSLPETSPREPNIALQFDAGLPRLIGSNPEFNEAIYRSYLEELENILGKDDFQKVSVHLTRMMDYLRGELRNPTISAWGGDRSQWTLVTDFLKADNEGQTISNADSNPAYTWLAQKANLIFNILDKYKRNPNVVPSGVCKEKI